MDIEHIAINMLPQVMTREHMQQYRM